MAPPILSVPNEVGRDMSTKPIVNFSMTCRRFRQLSGHFLVPRVNVDFGKSSLERFEEISRHPFIHKSVCNVVVLLTYFCSNLCDDFGRFAKFYHRYLTSHIQRKGYKVINRSVHWEAEKVADSWLRISQAERGVFKSHSRWHVEEDAVHRTLLKEAHAEYKRLAAEQEHLLQSGEFVQRVAAAMARMPRVTTLDITDRRGMSVAMEGGQAWTMKDGRVVQMYQQSHIYPVLIHLPIAIHRAGVFLKDLNIYINGLQRDEVLETDPGTLLALNAAVQSVKTICFAGSPVINTFNSNSDVLPRPEFRALPAYLAQLLKNPNLQEVGVDICGTGELWFRDSQNNDLVKLPGSVVSLPSNLCRQSLDRLSLCRFDFRLAELIAFISSLPSLISCLRLLEIHLLDGTWEEVLDHLRMKKFTDGVLRLADLTGGEQSTMTPEDRFSLFFSAGDRDNIGEINFLEQYCLRLKKTNPLRAFREGSWNEDDFMEEDMEEDEEYEEDDQ
ncbi:hypothetical protein V8F06_011192 [Rhypophila decipiens]